MPDGTSYTVKTLLGKGDSNAKLAKSDASGAGYLTVGLSLAPAKLSGFNVCPNASNGCRKACLFFAGQGAFSTVKTARIAKTRAFFQQRPLFLAMLRRELTQHVKRARLRGKRLAVRLNVLSDIPWEQVAPGLMHDFPEVQFYDYTKSVKRAIYFAEGKLPRNYHLTFSRSESNANAVQEILQTQCNVAVVFSSKNLPAVWNGRPVISGDETDLRFLDPAGSIVGLYAKGTGKKDTSGFVIDARVPLSLVR